MYYDTESVILGDCSDHGGHSVTLGCGSGEDDNNVNFGRESDEETELNDPELRYRGDPHITQWDVRSQDDQFANQLDAQGLVEPYGPGSPRCDAYARVNVRKRTKYESSSERPEKRSKTTIGSAEI